MKPNSIDALAHAHALVVADQTRDQRLRRQLAVKAKKAIIDTMDSHVRWDFMVRLQTLEFDIRVSSVTSIVLEKEISEEAAKAANALEIAAEDDPKFEVSADGETRAYIQHIEAREERRMIYMPGVVHSVPFDVFTQLVQREYRRKQTARSGFERVAEVTPVSCRLEDEKPAQVEAEKSRTIIVQKVEREHREREKGMRTIEHRKAIEMRKGKT